MRFRHTLGDLGPFAFARNETVLRVKSRVFDQWPTEGSLAKDAPSSVADLRLICGGRFLADGEKVSSLEKMVGAPTADSIFTVHVIVRPPLAKEGDDSGDGSSSSKLPPCCIIC